MALSENIVPLPPLAAELAAEVPHIDQYFGLWAIHEETFRAAVSRLRGMDLAAHVRTNAQTAVLGVNQTVTIHQAEPQQSEPAAQNRFDDRRHGDVLAGGVALISLTGTLQKRAGSLSAATSTIRARRAIRAAVADDAITAILLYVDSPGGTSAGTADLAADVRAAAKQKPLDAYIEDLGASAAYWVASQARALYVNATGWVGSIGTYAVIYDLSEAAANEGIKVHVLRTGEYKGAGVPGDEITARQLEEWQRVVNEINEHFIRGVAAGRHSLTIARVRELADGRVHLGAAAQKLGLVDGVQTLDETIANLQPKTRRKKPMSQQAETTAVETAAEQLATERTAVSAEPIELKSAAQPATIQELREACVGADADFLCGQLDAKATVSEATKAWMTEQQTRLEAAQQNAEQAQAAARSPGVDPLGSGSKSTAAGGDALEAFETAVAERQKARGETKAQAYRAVCSEQPELREAMVLAHNEQHKSRRSRR